MGNCCGNETQHDRDMNMNKASIKGNKNINIPVHQIVKLQALIRGFLTRNAIKKIYGFEVSAGLMTRGTLHIEMEPEKLEQQRARVQAIKESLPEFQYGQAGDQDYEPGISKETRPQTQLQDGSMYEGEWNVATD